MKRKVFSLILCLSLFLGVTLGSVPQQARAGTIGDVVEQMQVLYSWLEKDSEGLKAVRDAKQNVAGLPADANQLPWSKILTADCLLTPQVITKLGGKEQAQSELMALCIDAAKIQYSNNDTDLENNLKEFKEEHQATVEKLLPGVKIDDLYNFLLAVKDKIPEAISNLDEEKLELILKGDYTSLFTEWSREAFQLAAEDFPVLKQKIEEIGWNIDRLVKARDFLSEEVDSGKKAESALLKAYVRSETRFVKDGAVLDTGKDIVLYEGDAIPARVAFLGIAPDETVGIIVNAFLNWRTGNENVAKIESKKITARQAGETDLVAYADKPETNWVYRGKVLVKAWPSGTEEQSLPAGELTEEQTLAFGGGTVEIVLPAGLNIPSGAKITVTFIATADVDEVPAGIQVAGQVVDIKLEGATLDKPITIKLRKRAGAGKVAVFYNSGLNKWEYVPSSIEGDFVRAEITHTSIYGVLEDNEPPTNVAVSAGTVTQSSVQLNLSANDPSGLKQFDIYRNGSLIGTASTTLYTDSGLSSGTTYRYKITATDNLGNTSAFSPEISVTTQSAGGPSGGGGGAVTPYVSKYVPEKNAVDVALDAEVSATFNMDVEEVDLSGVTIKDADGNAVSGVSATLDGRVLRVAHDAFDYATKYTVTIPEKAVKSANYSRYNEEISWSFTTVQKPEEPAELPFTDLSPTHWAWGDIKKLYDLKIVGGYPDRTFRPENNITRAEFTKILIKALNIPEETSGTPRFKDVQNTAWYYGCVQAAARAGLAKGYENNEFRPDNPITREEVAAMLVRALGRESEAGAKAAEELRFADAEQISSWARGSVVIAAEEGLVGGYPDNTFRPQRNATRAETCAMIVRFLEKK